jgi:rRNA maturation protein Nop10
MQIISNASCALYTLKDTYIESGVSTIGEFIAS